MSIHILPVLSSISYFCKPALHLLLAFFLPFFFIYSHFKIMECFKYLPYSVDADIQTFIAIHILLHACIHMTYIFFGYIHICTYAHAQTYIHIHMYTYKKIYIYTFVDICIQRWIVYISFSLPLVTRMCLTEVSSMLWSHKGLL